MITCDGYQLTMTPWRCIENQLSDFCLPGFPCHVCQAGVGLGLRMAGGDARPTWDKKTMTRAVARDLGLI